MTVAMYIFSILIFCNVVYLNSADEALGPVDLTIERVEKCEDPDRFRMDVPVTMKKVNRTHAGFSGCIEFEAEINGEAAMNLTAAKWGDGGWKPNAINQYLPSACKVLNEQVTDPWNKVAMAMGLPSGMCPLPKGKYCFEKLVLELEGIFPSMIYGKFRVDVELLLGGESVACLRAFINADPAKSPKKGV